MLLIVLGTFLRYVKMGDQSFTMFALGGPAKSIGILFIVIGFLSGLFSYFGKDKVWWLSIINLWVSGLAAFLIFAHIGKLGKEATVMGMCVYVIAAGTIVSFASSVLGIAKK